MSAITEVVPGVVGAAAGAVANNVLTRRSSRRAAARTELDALKAACASMHEHIAVLEERIDLTRGRLETEERDHPQ